MKSTHQPDELIVYSMKFHAILFIWVSALVNWLAASEQVTPPQGKEAGYVPIATRQEWGGAATPLPGH